MAASNDHEEECKSRLLVSFSLLNSDRIVDVLRQCTKDELNTKLKAYNPPLEKRTVVDIVETLKNEGYNTDKMKIKKKKLEEIIMEPDFRFDAFTFAKLFVKPDDINAPSFVAITDPKVYIDLLEEVPNIPIDAEDIRIIRNRCGHNDFLKCDKDSTERFVEVLKEIAMKTKPKETEYMPIIKEIEKWEKRMTRFTNKNLDTLDDILELQEVVNPWLHIAIADSKMKQLVDRISEKLGQKLADHDLKIEELKKTNEVIFGTLGKHDSDIERLKMDKLSVEDNVDPNGILKEWVEKWKDNPTTLDKMWQKTLFKDILKWYLYGDGSNGWKGLFDKCPEKPHQVKDNICSMTVFLQSFGQDGKKNVETTIDTILMECYPTVTLYEFLTWIVELQRYDVISKLKEKFNATDVLSCV